MTQFSVLQTEVRNRCVEPSARLVSDAQIKTWLNQGYHEFAVRTNWCERITGVVPVVNQFEYNLDSQTLKIENIRWDDKYNVEFRDMTEFVNLVGIANAARSSRPWFYTQIPWDKSVRVYPIPSTAAATTTLTGGHNSSVTTLTVGDTTSFPAFGRVIIGTEQIRYYDKSATSFLQCVRGDGATTAASHSNADTISEIKMIIHNSYDPPDMSADTDVPAMAYVHYHNALVDYAEWKFFQKRMMFKEAGISRGVWENKITAAISDRERQNRDRMFAIKEDEAYF